MSENNTCAICEAEIHGHGHNGQPVVDARVCDFCNDFEIITARINKLIYERGVKGEHKPDESET